MLILFVRGMIDLGDALLDHNMEPQVQVCSKEVHAAKSVNEPIDVQVQPGVEDDERCLQCHKDDHEQARGCPHGLVTGISWLILEDGDQLHGEEDDVSHAKENRSVPDNDAGMTLMNEIDERLVFVVFILVQASYNVRWKPTLLWSTTIL